MRDARSPSTERIEIDLWNTRDTDLLGRVGEVVGWKCLWRRGISTWPFWQVIQTDLFREHMTQDQKNYLSEFGTGNWPGRAWDLVGIEHGGQKPCLVEVKTTRSVRCKADRRKIAKDVDRFEAKKRGFGLWLVTVQLTDTWKFVVHLKRL
ncbi:MAG: hypothetical protein MUO89_04970 [Dehalococcoidia bacterium]|nr:hypothetical protein [Dehalococcoidia bacterium]